MKATRFRNWKVGATMSFFAAACFFGAAIFILRSPQPGLGAAYVSIAILNVVVGAVLQKKSKQI